MEEAQYRTRDIQTIGSLMVDVEKRPDVPDGGFLDGLDLPVEQPNIIELPDSSGSEDSEDEEDDSGEGDDSGEEEENIDGVEGEVMV